MKPVYIVEPHADTAELEKALLVEDGFDVRLVLWSRRTDYSGRPTLPEFLCSPSGPRRQSRRTYHRQGRLVGNSRGAGDDDEGRSRRLAGRLGRVREAVRLQRVPPDCASALSTPARIGVVDEEEERVVAATGGSHACTPRMDGITAIVTPTRFRDLKEERSLWKILHPTRHTRPVCLGRQ